MNSKETFSAETLNAFIDNQLSADEKARIYARMEQDSDLAHYMCRLRTTHELIHDAYDPTLLPPQPHAYRQRTPLDQLCRAVAIIMLFITGGVAGWIGHAQLQAEANHSNVASIESIATATDQNVLLHISSGDPTRIDVALNDAEQFLRKAHEQGRTINLEILANEEGAKLLNANNGNFATRVAELKRDYQNISFMACAKTLQRLKEKGIHYDLVPQAQIVPSALDEIVGRMEKGWVYIRV